MLYFDKNTKQIQLNRGDSADLTITAKDSTGEDYTFQVGDDIKFKITEAKNESKVIMEKTITIAEATKNVNLYLSAEDTKIGDIISKPVIYWYEISIEKTSGDVLTIIGYDNKGPKEFVLNPEAANVEMSE